MTPFEIGYYWHWLGLDWESCGFERGSDEYGEYQLGTIDAVFHRNAQQFYNTQWDRKPNP